MPTWNEFFDWMVKGLLGAVAIQGVRVLSDMNKSIESLNQNVSKIIERTEWHSREIDRLDGRVNQLENNKYGPHSHSSRL